MTGFREWLLVEEEFSELNIAFNELLKTPAWMQQLGGAIKGGVQQAAAGGWRGLWGITPEAIAQAQKFKKHLNAFWTRANNIQDDGLRRAVLNRLQSNEWGKGIDSLNKLLDRYTAYAPQQQQQQQEPEQQQQEPEEKSDMMARLAAWQQQQQQQAASQRMIAGMSQAGRQAAAARGTTP